jgi:hypothetical protein
MSGREMRKHALRRYIVFRIKAIEFLDLNALRNVLQQNRIDPMPQVRPPQFMSDSVRTVVLSWFALFIDKTQGGMDVTKLWTALFPQHKNRVAESLARMQPGLDAIREFRDRAGFHADKPLKYFGARNRIQVERKAVDAAVREFVELLKFFLNKEVEELPELEAAHDSLLDELERKHKRPYEREQFKAYVMVARTAAK